MSTGYVFSYTEYAGLMTTNNPWMHLLAEILSTESFIIAGTSFNEGDLGIISAIEMRPHPSEDEDSPYLFTLILML